jgi:hypothetical protein
MFDSQEQFTLLHESPGFEEQAVEQLVLKVRTPISASALNQKSRAIILFEQVKSLLIER